MKTIADVMTKSVESTERQATLQAAARKMADLNVGSLPVCDGGKVVGIVTDRDIAVRGVAKGLDVTKAPVGDVMSQAPRTVRAGESVDAALKSMGDAQIRRLPVVDDAGTLVGIVSLGDMAVRQPDAAKVESALSKISDDVKR